MTRVQLYYGLISPDILKYISHSCTSQIKLFLILLSLAFRFGPLHVQLTQPFLLINIKYGKTFFIHTFLITF